MFLLVCCSFCSSSAQPLGAGSRNEWHLTAPAANYTGPEIALNGKTLLFDESTLKLPTMDPDVVGAGGDIVVEPLSVAFVEFPHAGAKACGER